MARRIAAAILLTVWAILVAGGVAAYWVTRAVLVGDLDATLAQRATAVAHAVSRGESIDAAAANFGAAEDRYVVVTDPGRIMRRAADSRARRPVPAPQKAAFSRLADGRLIRTVTVHVPRDPAAPEGGPVTVTYSGPAEQVGRVLYRLEVTLAVCGLAAGLAAAAAAAWAARAALRPLHAASDVVGDIDERKLDRRIDADSLPPELRPVAARLNGMLERLERAFAQRKQFLADASHELRTPVAALVTTIEVALRRRRGAEELTSTLETCLADARHLKRLVHVLMEHARGEAAASRAEPPETLDAAALLGECADMAAALGIPKAVRVERSIPSPMTFVTQPQRLRSVVTNLLSNAVEYNRAGGLVEISARLDEGALDVTVRDTGRGIPSEHLPYLFEPFYRVDGTRGGRVNVTTPGLGSVADGDAGDEAPHLGLGLFLVDSHLKALGGRCTVQSEPGVGTTMRVTVPPSETPEGITPHPAGGAQRPEGPAAPQNNRDVFVVLQGARTTW